MEMKEFQQSNIAIDWVPVNWLNHAKIRDRRSQDNWPSLSFSPLEDRTG